MVVMLLLWNLVRLMMNQKIDPRQPKSTEPVRCGQD